MSLEPLDKMEKAKRPVALYPIIGALLFFLVAGVLLVKLYEREKPQITMLSDISRFGLTKEVTMELADARSGVRSVTVLLIQAKKEVRVFEKDFPRQGYFSGAGPHRVEETFTVNSRSLGFRDGVAEMRVTVRDYSWWGWMAGNATTVTYPVVLDTRPPEVNILDSPRYIKTGSAGVVVYKVSESVERNGVMINGFFYPGFPLPKHGEGVYGAMIGLPYDMDKVEEAYVSAVDRAGNSGKAAFGMILRKMRLNHDRINISKGFLAMKLPEFAQHYPELTGTPLEQYLYVNKVIRRQNYRTVQEVCGKPLPERLWDGPFKRMARSSRRANFADERSYYYEGKKIDEEVHLGVDLASVRHAEVQAANRGMVVFAEYLGIYGNTVILDHGQGLFSLYSHMSQIDVAKDDMVEKGARLGLTGNTGLAGGDHLHFSILIDGIFVNPVEWWDARWLQQNILSVL